MAEEGRQPAYHTFKYELFFQSQHEFSMLSQTVDDIVLKCLRKLASNLPKVEFLEKQGMVLEPASIFTTMLLLSVIC